ncbi:FKBP-type peptidyl-prolyl cis-trans isomerase [Arachidicoccus rhizosphaerae]|uniref:Peptidyl-prolyl cis-trans isomerase n=1 Tax=Arachidicoccus rhizosphaerae TaxID=551991 RepID=A0A1H3Z6C3_9BACT|nr:FKBP-type peptidyl-prolyl cis-trans isomerase [Arachidicoccus rhizosphaerae]SEA18974.1 FKBP-type peptidyl-prolyl cis-trans isomerase [Arachidicoccus rhizosphaerae]
MKKLIFACSAAAILGLAACNVNYKTTPSGMKYKILSGKVIGADTMGVQAAPGDIIKFKFKFTIPELGDTVWRNAYDMMPQYTKVDTSARVKMTFLEIFPQLKSGDSAEVVISVDSIIKQGGPNQGLPPFMTKGRHVKAIVSILNVFKDEASAQKDVTKERTKQQAVSEEKLKKATADLDKYIKDKGLKATKTKSGAYVVIDEPGDISKKADSGMTATIKYTGSLLSSGKPFDSNIDSTIAGHTEPLPIAIGQHRSIQGMDEGLRLFGKGAKGTIYIPAELGYGDRDQGDKIPAFSNLKFDIQVLDVTPSDSAKK